MKVAQAIQQEATAAFFGNRDFSQIHLDIGCGRGQFLMVAASQFKDSAFIGIELNQLTHRITEKELRQSGLSNAYSVNEEALSFLRVQVFSRAISEIHVYFPTPYIRPLNQLVDVKIKVKTLLLDHQFLAHCKRVLLPGGTLRIVSDHLGYIRRARRHAQEVGFAEVPWVSPIEVGDLTHIVGTGCEIEMLKNGKQIYSVRFL